MKNTLLLGAASAALVSGAAVADYQINFAHAGDPHTPISSVHQLTGSLGDMAVNTEFTNGGGWTWAGDFHIAIVDPNGNHLQFGGYDYDSGHAVAGDFPSSWDSSTSGSFSHTASLASMGLGGDGDWTVHLTHGYSGGGGDAWDGNVTLHGLTLVPAPGALALLGLAGLAGRRRRR